MSCRCSNQQFVKDQSHLQKSSEWQGMHAALQVKLRGFRIELGEVENVLAQCRDVQLAVAQLCPDSAGTPHLVAYVTPLEVSTDACKAEMQASVPGDLLQPLQTFFLLSSKAILRSPVVVERPFIFAHFTFFLLSCTLVSCSF